jgi:hypothetical protein
VIRLRDTIHIKVPPEVVWTWLEELPAHYREWHPAHVTCRYERGESLEVGATLCVEERLHRKVHRLRLRATHVVPGRMMRYRSRVFTGAFLLEPANGGTRFTAEVAFGIPAPVIGTVIDAVLRTFMARRLAAFRAHMHEEGENLKRLLERQAPSQCQPESFTSRRTAPCALPPW